jgi:hypothetical protein
VAENGGFGGYFEHLYTSVSGVANHGASASTATDRAPELFAESDIL